MVFSFISFWSIMLLNTPFSGFFLLLDFRCSGILVFG